MKTFDGKEIYTYLWDQTENPAGVVQICHGLGEHCGRYRDFAEFLNRNGFIAFGDDHRGHGLTDRAGGDCGADAAGDTVRDLLFFHDYLRKQYPGLPMVFFGHSYGSLLAQRFIELAPQLDVCVMTGVNGMNHGLAAFMTAVMAPVNALAGKKILSMDSSSMDKKFEDKDVGYAWLSRDKAVRQAYIDDPLCGGPTAIRFNYSMMKLMSDLSKDAELARISDTLPIGIFCGQDDAAGGYGSGPRLVYERLLKHGKQANLKLYPGARHEVLNEWNKDEVYEDILAFIQKFLLKS